MKICFEIEGDEDVKKKDSLKERRGASIEPTGSG